MTDTGTPPSATDLPQREPGASGYDKFLIGNLLHAVYAGRSCRMLYGHRSRQLRADLCCPCWLRAEVGAARRAWSFRVY